LSCNVLNKAVWVQERFDEVNLTGIAPVNTDLRRNTVHSHRVTKERTMTVFEEAAPRGSPQLSVIMDDPALHTGTRWDWYLDIARTEVFVVRYTGRC
jgi:hypothetical protein